MNQQQEGRQSMWKKRLADMPIVDAVVLGAAGACLLVFIAAGVALAVAAVAVVPEAIGAAQYRAAP
jgi:hypothetical protein